MAAAARIGGVGVRVEHCQFDHATVVQDPQAVVEQVTSDLDLLACGAARRFPLPPVGFDDVVGRHLVQGAHHETAMQVGVVFGEAQDAALLPALPRRVAVQGLVRGVVVEAQKVAQPQVSAAQSGSTSTAPSRARKTRSEAVRLKRSTAPRPCG